MRISQQRGSEVTRTGSCVRVALYLGGHGRRRLTHRDGGRGARGDRPDGLCGQQDQRHPVKIGPEQMKQLHPRRREQQHIGDSEHELQDQQQARPGARGRCGWAPGSEVDATQPGSSGAMSQRTNAAASSALAGCTSAGAAATASCPRSPAGKPPAAMQQGRVCRPAPPWTR